MLNFVKIDRLTEDNFTEIIENVGGKRFSSDHSREDRLNADYIFENAIVELKLIEEEGLEKEIRQRKLFDLFINYERSPVIVMDPQVLSEWDRRKYFKILEGPIKTQVKKASKQLKSTTIKVAKEIKKFLLIVNNGYSALDAEEFKKVVNKCVKNDTSNIDYVISCGIYYYSDGFDSYFIAPFELEKITSSIEPSEFNLILNSWYNFINNYMSRFVMEPERRENARLPVLDIEFEVNGITFVKPTPPFGKKSGFWVAGRPRINTSGIDLCPPVALTFPKLSRRSWNLMKNIISDTWKLKDSYEKWINFSMNEEKEHTSDLQPFVPIKVDFNTLTTRTSEGCIKNFCDLCNFVNDDFDRLVKKIIFSARSIENTKIAITKYVYLLTREIGRDKKNDISSIYVVTNNGQPEITETILEDKQIFFEYGLSLAAAYAIKTGIDIVLYYRDKKYAWT